MNRMQIRRLSKCRQRWHRKRLAKMQIGRSMLEALFSMPEGEVRH